MANHSFTFRAGAYRGQLVSDSLGQTEGGIRFEFAHETEEVRGDNMGDSVQDLIYRGWNCFVSSTFIEFSKTGLLNAIWPWDTTFGEIGTIGVLAGATYAKALTLTKVVGTPTYWQTIVADRAILSPRFPVDLLLAPSLKRCPLRFQLLPYGTLDDEKWFVPTVAT